MLILDAKYYLLDFSNRNSFPSIGDIVKQYFYEASASRKKIGFLSEHIINAFIFPIHLNKPTVWFEVGGHASLDNDLFNVINSTTTIRKPILNFYMNADLIFERYINYKPYSEKEMIEIIDTCSMYLNQPFLS